MALLKKLFKNLIYLATFIIPLGLVALVLYPFWSRLIMHANNLVGLNFSYTYYNLAAELTGAAILLIYILVIVRLKNRYKINQLPSTQRRVYILLSTSIMLVALLAPATLELVEKSAFNQALSNCGGTLPNPSNSNPNIEYCTGL